MSIVDEREKHHVREKILLHIAQASTSIWLKEGRHKMSSSIGIKRCESGVAECSLFQKARQEG
jgi:hypothetical protein